MQSIDSIEFKLYTGESTYCFTVKHERYNENVEQ
jgi:hypothetical protein